MASRRLDPTYITAENAGADVTGAAVEMAFAGKISFHSVISSGTAPTGDLKVQVSNDDTNWETVTALTQSLTNNGSFFQELESSARYARLWWDRTSGTGNISCTINCVETGV